MTERESIFRAFKAERQALAVMDHPNIARVLDGGVTDQGRPYFAMEYVKGVPLTDYCDKAKLSVRERLELFLPICHAVQHAHQKGIIHRDLKPSNILICLYDGKPVPKVIDFGLAKAMHQSLTGQSIYTAHGMMVGTPLYMSPEQAEYNNLDIDTRTDVYALGVILYELLTGSTPLERAQMKEAAYNEVLQLIKEFEPPKPSTRLSGNASLPSVAAQRSIEPNELTRSISGDLDWVVMKALEKERSRRYETANGLAEDVRRHLADEPVSASPPSVRYKLHKFVKRNSVAVLAFGTVLAALLLGVSGTTGGMIWALSERDAAKAAQANAEESRKKADKSATLAEDQASRATIAEQRIAQSLETIKSTNSELRTTNYAFAVQAAFQAWQMGSLDRLSDLLSQCSPDAEESDLRGFEWRLLHNWYSGSSGYDNFECAAKVLDLSFSPNGRFIAGALFDGTVFLKDLSSDQKGQHFSPLVGKQEGFVCRQVSFLDDEVLLVAGGNAASNEQLGDEPFGRIVECIVGTEGVASTVQEFEFASEVVSLTVRSRDRVFFSTASDNKTRILSLDSRETDSVEFEGTGVAVTKDGRLLATATNDNLGKDRYLLAVYDLASGNVLAKIETGSQPRGLSFSRDGSKLFGSDSSGFWFTNTDGISDETQLEQLSWRRKHDTKTLPDRDWIALAGSDDATVRVYDFENGRYLGKFLHRDRVFGIALSANCRWLASGSGDRSIKLWDLKAMESQQNSGYAHFFASLSVSCRSEFYAFRKNARSVAIINTEDRAQDQMLDLSIQENAMLRGVALSSDADLLAAAYGDSVMVHDRRNATDQRLEGFDSVWGVCFSNDASKLAIGDKNRFYVVDRDTNKKSVLWKATGAFFEVSRFSRDGNYLACGVYYPRNAFPSHDGLNFARVWNLNTGFKEYYDFEYPGGIQSIAFSPNGKLIAIAGLADQVSIYNLESRSRERILQGNGRWLTAVSFSPDGRTLAACSPIGEIKFWRLPSFEPAGSMSVSQGIRRLEFGPDAEKLFWASMDGDVGYFEATPLSSLDLE